MKFDESLSKYNRTLNFLHGEPKMTALNEQIGGSHYKDFAIQPVEFIHRNGIDFLSGNVIKYVCRYKSKGGVKDLEKAKHYIELLIELSDNTMHKCDFSFISVNGRGSCICGKILIDQTTEE